MGRATAEYLTQHNFIVYALTRHVEKLQDIKQENIIPLEFDITNQESINKAVDFIYTKHKKIDVLINNAGYGLVSTVEDVSEEEMLEQFNINVFGVLRVCKATIPDRKSVV